MPVGFIALVSYLYFPTCHLLVSDQLAKVCRKIGWLLIVFFIVHWSNKQNEKNRLHFSCHLQVQSGVSFEMADRDFILSL